jgi:hypothetical protein
MLARLTAQHRHGALPCGRKKSRLSSSVQASSSCACPALLAARLFFLFLLLVQALCKKAVSANARLSPACSQLACTGKLLNVCLVLE